MKGPTIGSTIADTIAIEKITLVRVRKRGVLMVMAAWLDAAQCPVYPAFNAAPATLATAIQTAAKNDSPPHVPKACQIG